MENDTDPETVGAAAEGISECLKAAVPGHLTDAQAQGLVQKAFEHIDRSFARDQASGNVFGAKDEDGDDDDVDEEAKELICRRHIVEALEGVMVASPQVFIQALPFCAQK